MSSKKSINNLAICVENIAVAYQRRVGIFRNERFWALNNVSFDVFHGETLGVIGRNGVGKSTLLRLLAGIISPNQGRVINYGVNACLLSLQAGFVEHLTGRENAVLSGMILGLTRSEILGYMDEIETYADIGTFFDQPVRGYSTGMRARVGFSVAIHTNVDVILLDEVLGVGDADFRKKSALTMREKINSNKTVVLVSHYAGLISEVCDRVVWLDGHNVKMVGETEKVINAFKLEGEK